MADGKGERPHTDGAYAWVNLSNIGGNTFTTTYQAGVTYTLKFNVAAKSGGAGYYKVQLMSFKPGDPRASTSPVGTVVAEVTGKAIKSDMRENDGVVLTVPEGAAYIGSMMTTARRPVVR